MTLQMASSVINCHIGSVKLSVIRFESKHPWTYIIVGKNKESSDSFFSSVIIVEEFPCLIYNFSENRPLNTQDEAPFVPCCVFDTWQRVWRKCLLVKPSDDLLATIYPTIPISEDEGTFISLFFQQINAVVKFSHSFSNLLGSTRIPKFLRCQSSCMEVFLKTSISECTKKSWSDSLPTQAS